MIRNDADGMGCENLLIANNESLTMNNNAPRKTSMKLLGEAFPKRFNALIPISRMMLIYTNTGTSISASPLRTMKKMMSAYAMKKKMIHGFLSSRD